MTYFLRNNMRPPQCTFLKDFLVKNNKNTSFNKVIFLILLFLQYVFRHYLHDVIFMRVPEPKRKVENDALINLSECLLDLSIKLIKFSKVFL